MGEKFFHVLVSEICDKCDGRGELPHPFSSGKNINCRICKGKGTTGGTIPLADALVQLGYKPPDTGGEEISPFALL